MSVVKKFVLFLIRLYQAVPRHRTCRFTPSCSEYTHEAISSYGIISGTQRAIKRISKCHPLHPGGFDPVH